MSASKPDKVVEQSDEPSQYLTFVLSGEVFAIGILAIKEIIGYGVVTTVPMMPECVRGVINLRGSVVPVLDLAVRFGKTPAPAGKRTCIVIVEAERDGERETIGVVVDSVNAVMEIPAADIEPAPSFGPKISTEFIAGLAKVNGRFVILLALQPILAIDGLDAAETAADAVVAA